MWSLGAQTQANCLLGSLSDELWGVIYLCYQGKTYQLKKKKGNHSKVVLCFVARVGT